MRRCSVRSGLLCALLAAPVFAQAPPAYEIFAIRYATIPELAVSGLVAGADASRKLDIAMMVWLVRGGGKNILVDAGFYREQFFKQWHVTDFVNPAEAVRRAGVKPEEITDVIVTHMHWDHADGMDLFPNARVWLQKDELEYYAGSAWQSRRTHGGIDPDDVLAAVKLNVTGKMGLVNGDAQEILPGVTCYTGGKHTYASQFVGVRTAAGTVVLASDNMYLYENLEKHVPIAATLDGASNLRAQDRMKELAGDPKRIIPGHDPAVMTRFRNYPPEWCGSSKSIARSRPLPGCADSMRVSDPALPRPASAPDGSAPPPPPRLRRQYFPSPAR
jgi:glyoxylase-like metal-dependent hydrolase (beta-lactamase superfamily II)